MKIGKIPESNIMIYEYEKEEYKDKLEKEKAWEWCRYYRLTNGVVYPRAFYVHGNLPEIHHILEKCFAKNTLIKHQIGHSKGKDDTLFGLMSFTFILRGRYD